MNIRDVAKLAGVSPATVSRYINGTVNVSPKAAEKIERVLKLTEYTTDNKRPKVDFNRNRTIGVIVTDLSNPVYAEILTGIRDRAEHFGLSTLVMETKHKTNKEIETIIDLIRQRVDGMIMSLTNKTNDEAIGMLTSFKFPFCLLHTQASSSEPCVFVDNYKAGSDVASKLYELGHRNMAVAINRSRLSERTEERYLGFKDFMMKKRYPIKVLDIDSSNKILLHPKHLELLKSKSSPTAVFCTNDFLAIRLLKELKDNNIIVPEQLSVIGFDGMEFGRYLSNNLATVKIPNVEMGRIAVDILQNTKAGVKFSNKIAVDYQLDLSGTVQPLV